MLFMAKGEREDDNTGSAGVYDQGQLHIIESSRNVLPRGRTT